MPESYMKLLTGSTQYQNLEKALGDFSAVSDDLSELFAVLYESEGGVIKDAREIIGDVIKNSGLYIQKIESIMNTLKSNAEWMDGILTKWKGEAASGKILDRINSAPTYTRNSILKEVDGATAADGEKDVEFVTMYKCSVTSTVVKATSACIGRDGYIEVHTKNLVTVYEYETDHEASISEILTNGSPQGTTEYIGKNYSYAFYG